MSNNEIQAGMSNASQTSHCTRCGVRHRKSHQKSKGACQTCKIRRVKCDEAKPACNRCVSTGRTCDGYMSSRNPLPSTQKNASQAPIQQPSVPSWSLPERQAFAFYRSTTAQALCDAANHSEQHTWLHTIPQVAIFEPAVRHALCALGSLHWCTVKPFGGFSEPSLVLSMREYGKAMTAISTQETANINVALLCCLLFALYESFQGQQEDAMVHVRHGLLLLQTALEGDAHITSPWLSSVIHGPPSVNRYQNIRSILIRLVCHLKMLGGHPPGSDTLLKDNFPLAPAFQTSIEASQAFEAAYLAGIESFEMRSGRVCVTRAGFDSTMQRWTSWCAAFDAFTGPLDVDYAIRNDSPDLLRLLVYRRVCKITLAISPSTSETVFDDFLPDIRYVLDLYSRLVDIMLSGRAVKTTATATVTRSAAVHLAPNLTLFSGPLLEILYLICWKCRDPSLRRRALRLLSAFDVRNGLLDSKQLAVYAAKIIETEEENARNLLRHGKTEISIEKASDIPAAARLNSSTSLEQFLKLPTGREMLFHNHKHEHILQDIVER